MNELLSYTPHPSFKNVQAILKSGQDKLIKDSSTNNSNASEYGITRGAEYYRGDDRC